MSPRATLQSCTLLIFFIAAQASPASAADAFRYPVARHGKGDLRYIDKVPVLILRGTPAEMGDQLGTLAMKPAAKVMELFEGFAAQQIPANTRPLTDIAARAHYNKFPAKYREELEAAAKVSGVQLQSLILANTIGDLQQIVGCSSLVVSRHRSTTKGPLLGHNIDIPFIDGLAQYSLLIIWQPEGTHAFAMPTLPGFMALGGGMNSKGLAWGTHGVPGAKDGSPRFDPNKTSSVVAARRTMEECDSFAAARIWLNRNRMATHVSVAVSDPKHQGVLEITSQSLYLRDAVDGICCATNHFRAPELATDLDCWRYPLLFPGEKVERLAVQDVGSHLKAVTLGKLTFQTMIFEPATLRIHLGMESVPSTNIPLTTIDLTELFKSTAVNPK